MKIFEPDKLFGGYGRIRIENGGDRDLGNKHPVTGLFFFGKNCVENALNDEYYGESLRQLGVGSVLKRCKKFNMHKPADDYFFKSLKIDEFC